MALQFIEESSESMGQKPASFERIEDKKAGLFVSRKSDDLPSET